MKNWEHSAFCYVSCRPILNFEIMYRSVSSVIAAESKVYPHIIFWDFEESS